MTTCIAVLDNENNVYVGCDSCATFGYYIYNTREDFNTDKIFKINETYFMMSGNMAVSTLLKEYFTCEDLKYQFIKDDEYSCNKNCKTILKEEMKLRSNILNEANDINSLHLFLKSFDEYIEENYLEKFNSKNEVEKECCENCNKESYDFSYEFIIINRSGVYYYTNKIYGVIQVLKYKIIGSGEPYTKSLVNVLYKKDSDKGELVKTIMNAASQNDLYTDNNFVFKKINLKNINEIVDF